MMPCKKVKLIITQYNIFLKNIISMYQPKEIFDFLHRNYNNNTYYIMCTQTGQTYKHFLI